MVRWGQVAEMQRNCYIPCLHRLARRWLSYFEQSGRTPLLDYPIWSL